WLPSAPRVRAPQRAVEILCDPGERQLERRAPANQHVIVARAHPFRPCEPHDLPQTATDPVALDGIADLLRYGEAATWRAGVIPLTGLQYERRGRNLCARRRGEKVRPLLQSFHGSNARTGRCRAQADSRLRPRDRRALTTLRPPLVAMRARKP